MGAQGERTLNGSWSRLEMLISTHREDCHMNRLARWAVAGDESEARLRLMAMAVVGASLVAGSLIGSSLPQLRLVGVAIILGWTQLPGL